MAYTVVIKAGLTNVVLPNGTMYQAGDTVILTDEQFGVMPAATKTAVLQSSVIVAVPAS
ncbi:hypothetical protein QFZ75_007895 [Streptomyces sp. V3I8]|uniref:hypothetical protein n=1 Tax=Streptomyces sp. V3I8 TaxID=3042279 RepID=UPI002780AB53|nr:hypothetical protein [Streptomyces sp. V3I8]MDQ1041393.1 hypothetical protein [Streptomyces sp. V3I8]